MKLYEITNKRTNESVIINADNFQDACNSIGWSVSYCHYIILTDEPTQETIEDTLREDTNERLLYCNTCDEGTPYKDMGYVYGQYCCITCADGMGEKLTSRGCIA